MQRFFAILSIVFACQIARAVQILRRLTRSSFLTFGVNVITLSGWQGWSCLYFPPEVPSLRPLIQISVFSQVHLCVRSWGMFSFRSGFHCLRRPKLSSTAPGASVDCLHPRRRVPCSSTASAAWDVCGGFDHGHSQMWEVIPHWNLICLSLIIPGAEHFSRI